MMRPGIEVAICTYNGAGRMRAVLDALAAQTLPSSQWSVLLVDNASTDDTAARALASWRRADVALRVVREPRAGVKMARLKALSEASREFVCFCDDDNLLEPAYLETGVAIMRDRPLVGALGGMGVASSALPLPDWFASAAPGYAVGPQADAEGEVPVSRAFVYTAGMILRRAAWARLELTGYEPRLTGRQGSSLSSGEDNEICLLLSLMGWKIHFSPRLVFRHVIGPGRLDERYCRELYRGFGEATATLNVYRDFVLGRATPSGWLRCALLRLAQSWLIRARVTARRPFGRMPIGPSTLRREVDAGLALGYRENYGGRRLIGLYAEVAEWLAAARGEAA